MVAGYKYYSVHIVNRWGNKMKSYTVYLIQFTEFYFAQYSYNIMNK